MLQKTFLHIQGVGEVTERKIWASGIKSWDDYLQSTSNPFDSIRGDVIHSKERFGESDWNFFDKNLPSIQKWRAFGELGDRVLYVDIETTGYQGDDEITVIGTFDGHEAKSFVAGKNLEAAIEEMENHPLIVTYNGAQFDLPVIKNKFRYNFLNHIHIDLRFPLQRLGYRGGLKSIERQLNIARSEETKGLSGFDAVRLWHAYQDGSQEALHVLLDYNAEDTKNLHQLMQFVYRKLSANHQ